VATQLLRNGVDIVTVADIMDHARIDTVRLYTNSRELHQAGENLQVAC
jgi:site-specific recombinase XerD